LREQLYIRIPDFNCSTTVPNRPLPSILQHPTAVLPKPALCSNCPKSVPNRPLQGRTAVLPKIPHSTCCNRVPNRPLRGRRGRFRTLLQLLECGIFGRTAVEADLELYCNSWSSGMWGERLYHIALATPTAAGRVGWQAPHSRRLSMPPQCLRTSRHPHRGAGHGSKWSQHGRGGTGGGAAERTSSHPSLCLSNGATQSPRPSCTSHLRWSPASCIFFAANRCNSRRCRCRHSVPRRRR